MYIYKFSVLITTHVSTKYIRYNFKVNFKKKEKKLNDKIEEKKLNIHTYLYCHPKADCFIVSQLFSVTRHVKRLKLGSKLAHRYVRFSIRPLS